MTRKQFYLKLQSIGYSKEFCNKIKFQHQDEMRKLYNDLIFANRKMFNLYCKLWRIDNIDCI